MKSLTSYALSPEANYNQARKKNEYVFPVVHPKTAMHIFLKFCKKFYQSKNSKCTAFLSMEKDDIHMNPCLPKRGWWLF